jgi:hypothetical protein
MSAENQIDALKGKCSDAALFQRAVNDVMQAILRPLNGLSLRQATTELERLQAKIEGVRNHHERQTIRIPGWGRPRKD